MKYNLSETLLKKKAIVDVVANLMDEEGLKNVKIKDICDGANISVGAFYHYFRSKESIAKEMYELMDEYFMFNYEDIISHSDSIEDILDFVSRFGEFVEQWGYYANLLIMRYSIENRKNQEFNSSRKTNDVLNSIIKSGIENKHFLIIIDPNDLAKAILVLIRGYLLEWVKVGDDYPVKENMLKHTKWLLMSIQN